MRDTTGSWSQPSLFQETSVEEKLWQMSGLDIVHRFAELLMVFLLVSLSLFVPVWMILQATLGEISLWSALGTITIYLGAAGMLIFISSRD